MLKMLFKNLDIPTATRNAISIYRYKGKQSICNLMLYFIVKAATEKVFVMIKFY